MLCDGSTDISSAEEQEVVYISYRDTVTLRPTLKFFNTVAPKYSQDVDSLKKHYPEAVPEKMVFLSSDGTSVNGRKNSVLIRLFQEYYEWLIFMVF